MNQSFQEIEYYFHTDIVSESFLIKKIETEIFRHKVISITWIDGWKI